MTPEQQQQIRVAASLIAQRCIWMIGYPTVYSASEADGIQADLDKIKSVFYELDALKNDSASVHEERKPA